VNDIQQFAVTVIGGLAAIVIGVLGVAGDPPILALGNTLSVALIIAGLGVLGIGPIRTAFSVAQERTAASKARR
jgi:hypothetical protein